MERSNSRGAQGLLLFICIFQFLLSQSSCFVSGTQPNIVFVLTDDQDSVLGSEQHMPSLQALMGGGGSRVSHMFASTPVCCPSRSSFMTGRYIHNIGVRNNTVDGNCAGEAWKNGPERENIGAHMKHAGYRSGFFGKCKFSPNQNRCRC